MSLDDILLQPTVIDEGSTGIEHEQVEDESVVIHEPFDPSKIRVIPKTFTIDLILNRIRQNVLDLAPDFQRGDDIWNEQTQSRLIESILIRIPIPAFYVDATDDDHWLIVDGLQRITSLKKFILDEELQLTGLEFLHELEGRSYSELNAAFQRRIMETQLIVYLIESGTPAKVKFNIFRRINTGGLPLSSQEIRHALNQGPATILLKELGESEGFLRATARGISDKRMAARECVLRFLAFTLTPYQEYPKSGDLDGFLNDTMFRLNKMSEDDLEALRARFEQTMVMAYCLFGDDAFRKRYRPGDSRNPINKALFEAWSVNLATLNPDEEKLLVERKDMLQRRFMSLMNNTDFSEAISQGTGDVNKVAKRFGEIENLVREVLS